MSLATIMAADAETVLAEIGETVTFHPDDETDRAITAVVVRESLASADQPRGPMRMVSLYVLNDATSGIAASEASIYKKVTLAKDIGGEQITMRIKRLLGQTAGWTIVELV